MRVKEANYIEKPWGHEKWIAVNEHYALKEIFLKKGCRTSLQYHDRKIEHCYLLSGKVAVEEDNEQHELVTNIYEPGDIWTEEPGFIHRVSAIEDAVYMEASTPDLDDVVRVEDDYKRK